MNEITDPGGSNGRADVLRLALSDGASRLTPTVASADVTVGELQYTDCGDGPALVFLHGVLMSGSVWDLLLVMIVRIHQKPSLG